MARYALEVAAVTVAVAGASALAGWLELGTRWGLPAIAGPALLCAAVVFLRSRRLGLAAAALHLAGAGAFLVDWFIVFCVGAGHLVLRDLRDGPLYPALMVLLFLWPALVDGRLSAASSGASAPSRGS